MVLFMAFYMIFQYKPHKYKDVWEFKRGEGSVTCMWLKIKAEISQRNKICFPTAVRYILLSHSAFGMSAGSCIRVLQPELST